ncbi:MAG: helix-turn-helix domain-containing protein [Oscillospiraceae bacterium]|nr:helix-turn-helix domain-containing protein [Lachnospiraceae bacterium]MBO7727991.1 helix-turn-helix domain-containing protein [Oscillospiraceae bacterium]
MKNEYTCDRCGEKTAEPIRLYGGHVDPGTDECDITSQNDFCPRCMAGLIGWIKKAEVKLKSHREIIIDLYMSGKSLQDIELITGVNVAAVSRIIAAEGLRDTTPEEPVRGKKGGRYKRTSPEMVAEMQRLRALGVSCDKIAARLGVAHGTVNNCLRRAQNES